MVGFLRREKSFLRSLLHEESAPCGVSRLEALGYEILGPVGDVRKEGRLFSSGPFCELSLSPVNGLSPCT